MTQARARSAGGGPTALDDVGPITAGERTFTPAQLTSVLHRSGTLRSERCVTEVRAQPLGVGESMMSELALLQLTYDSPDVDRAPSTLVVKAACADPYRRGIADRFGFYRREVEFYDHMAATAGMRTPQCYGAVIDQGSSEFTLLLEDVSGHRRIPQVDGCGRGDARLVAHALADFHATWWDRSDAATGAVGPMASPDRIDDVVETFTRSWPTCAALAGARIPDELRAVGDRWATVAPNLIRALVEPRTVCHGDFRLDNLCFAGDEVVAFDWQLLTLANGVTDLAYFVSQSMRTQDRRGHDRALLGTYLERLAEHGVDYGIDRAWEVYRTAVLAMIVFPVSLYGGYDDLPQLGQRTTAAMLDRAVATITELEAWNVPSAS